MFGLFGRNQNRALIDKLHGEIMAGVLHPALYLHCGVPDTFEGRFEMLALHGALVVRRIEKLPSPGPDLAQDLMDGIFRHHDATLREMGVGDLAVPKRMKKHAESFMGRAFSYAGALEGGGVEVMRLALARNVLGDEAKAASPEVERLAKYVLAIEEKLASYGIEHFSAGKIGFPPPETGGQ
jgi:cytochrome b pre-mRNA-processing protein 3